MKRYTLSSPVFVAVLGSVLLAAPTVRAGVPADEGPVARELPAGIAAAYRTLSGSILSEDLPTFMTLFHRDFIYESLDGAALDRGPWRRLWLDRFSDLRYEKMAFNVVEILEKGDDRVMVSVRRVAVVEKRADGAQHLEETMLQDTWTRAGTTWELELRVESEVVSRGAVADDGGRRISSPRVAALAESVRGGDKDAVGAFWKDVRKSGAPLIEPIPDDPDHDRVTFLWRGGGREASVRVSGGLPAAERSKPLFRLGGTDVWYRSEPISTMARFIYEFELVTAVEMPASGGQAAETIPVRSTSADPLNPRSLDGGSLVEMKAVPPGAPTEKVAGRPHGTVKRHTISSDVLGERRFVTVYTPPGYGTLSSPCVPAFVIDSGSYKSRRVTGAMLDNLIAEKKIRETVLFMVHDEGSSRETLEASEEFVRFLGEELVAWARANFEVQRLPRQTIIGGSGPGGLLAVSTAIAYPETFGEVLAENGTFTRCVGTGAASSSPCIPRRLAVVEKLPLRFFLVVGSLEDASERGANHHLRDVLDARGYSTEFRIVAANRHATTWQSALADWFTALATE